MKFNFKKTSREDIYKSVRIDRLPTDVTSSIPYTNVFKNGVIETNKGTFTRQYKMKDANLKSKMLLQVHDELIFDVIKEEKDELEKIVKDTMENCVKINVPFKVSVDYGNNWYETK